MGGYLYWDISLLLNHLYMDIYQLKAEDIKRNLEELHQVVFEVTEKCNLKCDYCLYSGIYKGYSQRNWDNMSADMADSVIDYLLDIWKKCDNRPHRPVFVGFYGGEPLMNMPLVKHIIERLETVELKNRRFIFTMTSNAVLLDKYADYLAEKKISLLISLDGPDSLDSHRNFDIGYPSFPIVEKNIRFLKNNHPTYFHDKVNFNAVISEVTDLDVLQQYFSKEFGKSPKLSEINGTNISECCKGKFGIMYRSKEDIFKDKKLEIDELGFWMENPRTKRAMDYIINFSGNSFDSYNALLTTNLERPQIPSGTCAPFYKKMFVTARGKILQCEKISHKYALGHVKDKKVNLNFEDIAKQFNKWMSQIGSQCKVCNRANACPQCIFQLDSMLNGEPICDHVYNFKRISIYYQKCLEDIQYQPLLYNKIINDVTMH